MLFLTLKQTTPCDKTVRVILTIFIFCYYVPEVPNTVLYDAPTGEPSMHKASVEKYKTRMQFSADIMQELSHNPKFRSNEK